MILFLNRKIDDYCNSEGSNSLFVVHEEKARDITWEVRRVRHEAMVKTAFIESSDEDSDAN